jgi:Cd2+/Zn2+-exporting ATPase
MWPNCSGWAWTTWIMTETRIGEQRLSEKFKIEMDLLLPQGNGCASCRARLEERLQAYRGVEVAHLDDDGENQRFCIHYDPELISSNYVRAVAIEEGALLEWRYRHETLPIVGMDCADCARTLESGVQRLDGVLWVSANFAAATLAVEYDAQRAARPAILSRVRALGYDVTETEAVREMVFRVDGLDCADCALHLEEALRHTPGVAQVSVDFALARLRLTPQDGAPGSEGVPQSAAVPAALPLISQVERVAQDMGYSLTAEGAAGLEGADRSWWQRLWARRRDLTTVVSGLLIALAAIFGLLGLPEAMVAGTFVAAIAVGGYYIARSGWAALRTAHSLDMNALMTIAAVGAVFVGEWAEGAVAMFLFSLGNTLEGYTMDRARNAMTTTRSRCPWKNSA